MREFAAVVWVHLRKIFLRAGLSKSEGKYVSIHIIMTA